MSSQSRIIWTLKEFTTVLWHRQRNKYDCNLGISGKRGDGKSTLAFKIFNSFTKYGFRPQKHQVYSQDDVIKLLSTQKFGFCWDDEAINSGYKRDFQQSGQKKLVKIVTNFRDNFNVYASALPFFYSLDKDLRELIFVHLHIIERGVAVILLPLSNQIHASDPWDTKNNIRIEEKENKRLEANPNAQFRYAKLTTFAGYLYFSDMTDKQRKKYEAIKVEKRAKNFELQNQKEEMTFSQNIYKLLTDGKLTKDGLIQVCMASNKKYSSVVRDLNRILKDNGESRTMRDFWKKEEILSLHSKNKSGISNLVPNFET